MARGQHTPEQVINKLRWAEVAIAEGGIVAEAARRIGGTQQTFSRWRSECGGLTIDQARRLKRPESENSRLKRAVADLMLDNQILKEEAEGTLSALPVAASVSTTSRRLSESQSGMPAGCWGISGSHSAMSRASMTAAGCGC